MEQHLSTYGSCAKSICPYKAQRGIPWETTNIIQYSSDCAGCAIYEQQAEAEVM